MANLSNINNKLIVTDGGNLLVNATANLTTYGGLTIDNISNPSIAMKTNSASGWIYNQYITNTGTNNFSMGVNQTIPYWGVKTGAGMDNPALAIISSGNVGIGTISPDNILHIETSNAGGPQIQLESTSGTASAAFINFDSTSLQLSTQRDMVDGDWYDTSKSWGGINIQGPAGGSFITFHTAAASNTSPAQRMRIDSGGSIIIGDGATSGTPTGDYRSLEIGRQGNTITGAPWKSNLYFSTNATITAGSTTFTYRYASEAPARMDLEDGNITFYNAAAGSVGSAISFTERMRIHDGGSITMGEVNSTNAPNNGILKIKTLGSTAGTCYPLLSIMGSTHLATRQYGIGMDPEGYSNRVKMFFGVDGMGNGYSYGDFVWNINTQVGNDIVSPTDERMRLDKGGDLKLKTGNLAITNTSKGILLGGTGTANQLRIYQHGTWAPQIYYQNATDQANATNSTQVGLYTRIGNICMVQFRLVWNQASGTPAVDNIGIKNLPFQGSTTNTYAEVPCFIKNYTGGPSPRGNLTLTLPGANSPIALFNDTNFVGNMGNAIGSGTKEIRFSFTYTTNG